MAKKVSKKKVTKKAPSKKKAPSSRKKVAKKKTTRKKKAPRYGKKIAPTPTKKTQRKRRKELNNSELALINEAKEILADKDPITGKFTKGNKIGPRFPKGKTGNALGRPPHNRMLTQAVEKILVRPASEVKMAKELSEAHGIDPTTVTVGDIVAYNHIGHVMNGEGPYMKEMWNRIEGKLMEVVQAQINGKMGISEIMAGVQVGKALNKDDD